MTTRRHDHEMFGHRADHPHDYLPAAGHDALLPAYDLLTRMMGVPELHARLVELADPRPEHEVLEVGCGTGNLVTMVKRLRPGTRITGVDPDPQALARASRKAKGLTGVRVEQGYGQALPYPDASFDVVLSALMLHHLEGEARARTAQEVLRVLRPGGALYVLDIGGRVSASDGFAARRQLRSDRLRDNVGEAIPRLLRGAGFADCVELSHRVSRMLGRLTYYRATRPA